MNDLLSEADDISYVEQASIFMGEHHEELGLGCDYWEITIDKPRESLINRLYLLNHAAKAIIAQQGEVKAACPYGAARQRNRAYENAAHVGGVKKL